MVPPAGRRNDARPEPRGDLDGEVADPAGGGRDQDHVAPLHGQEVRQGLVRGQADDRHPARPRQVERGGRAGDVGRGHEHELGPGAVVVERITVGIDAVPLGEAGHLPAEGRDRARSGQAEDERERPPHRPIAFAHQDVPVADLGAGHPDQHVARPRLGHRESP